MFGTEISSEFMRDLGLVVFAAGGALVVFGFGFGRAAMSEHYKSLSYSGQRVRVAFLWVSARNCYAKVP
jgi:hypothetical protein